MNPAGTALLDQETAVLLSVFPDDLPALAVDYPHLNHRLARLWTLADQALATAADLDPTAGPLVDQLRGVRDTITATAYELAAVMAEISDTTDTEITGLETTITRLHHCLAAANQHLADLGQPTTSHWHQPSTPEHCADQEPDQ
jgi:hypothetical protein